MIKFQINVCPICNRVLQLKQIDKINAFTCTNHIRGGHSHYQVEYDKNAVVQHIYVGDWSIANNNTSYRSKVYKKTNSGLEKWALVAETNFITADIESRILEKLYKLIT